MCATIVSLRLLCHAAHYFSSQASYLGTDTMNASSQEGDFQVDSAWILWVLVSDMYGIFSNVDLSSTSGRQPRATVITDNVLGVSWIILTNNSKGSFLCLVLLLFVRKSMALGGSIVNPCEKISLRLYMFMCAHRFTWILCNFRWTDCTNPYDFFSLRKIQLLMIYIYI